MPLFGFGLGLCGAVLGFGVCVHLTVVTRLFVAQRFLDSRGVMHEKAQVTLWFGPAGFHHTSSGGVIVVVVVATHELC